METGWYADPGNGSRFRWWDGARWTEQVGSDGRMWFDPLAGRAGQEVVLDIRPLDASSLAELVAALNRVGTPFGIGSGEITVEGDRGSHAAALLSAAGGPGDAAQWRWRQPRASERTLQHPASLLPAWSGPPAQVAYPASPRQLAPPRPSFQSIAGLRTALIVMWILVAVSALGLLGASIYQRTVIERLVSGELVSDEDLAVADDAVEATEGLLGLCLLAVFVLLVIWLWRAYTNISAFDVGPLRMGRGFAIGGWFIPLANVVIPPLLIGDSWRAADPDAVRNHRWRQLRGHAGVWTWWGLGVAATLANLVGSVTIDTIADARRVNTFGIVESILWVGAAVLAALTIRDISNRQHRRAEALGLAV